MEERPDIETEKSMGQESRPLIATLCSESCARCSCPSRTCGSVRKKVDFPLPGDPKKSTSMSSEGIA